MCPSHSISLEPYIIWLSFMVHMCQVIISPGFLFSFSIFWFFRLLEEYKCKKWSKMTKSCVRHAPYLRNHTSYDCHLCLTCANDNISSFFCFFFSFFESFDFSDCYSEVKGQKMVQNVKKFCLSRLVSQEPYIIWLSFMLHLCKMIISPGAFFIFLRFWFLGSFGVIGVGW